MYINMYIYMNIYVHTLVRVYGRAGRASGVATAARCSRLWRGGT